MEKKSKVIKAIKQIPAPVWVGIVIVIAVIRLIVLFSLRNGHHVDEVWSYGFANSYYAPHLYGEYDGKGLQNIGEWISGETFKEYITVDENQRFSFDSVLYNKTVDLSPPLYELILHFVSSFFPGKFSWWFAFSISLFSYIPALVFVYLISSEFADSKFAGLLTLVYYIFSGCGTANFLFLRIYHLFTLLSLCVFWCVLHIIKDSKTKKFYYVLALVTALLGYLTHYYFLVIAFLFTFFGALALLFKKNIKKFLALCITMLASVVLFFVIYPSALYMLLPYSSGDTSGTGYYNYPYYFDLAVANIRFFVGTIGFGINFNIPDLLAFLGITVFVLIVIGLLCFLFRNEKWMKNAKDKTGYAVKAVLSGGLSFFKKYNASFYVALFSVIGYLLIIPYSARLTNMGFVERYFFASMSIFIIVFMSVVGRAIKELCYSGLGVKISRIILAIIAVLLIVMVRLSNTYTDMFKFDYMDDQEIIDHLVGNDCYAVISSDRDLIWLAPVMYNSGKVFVDYQSVFNDEDYSGPEFESEYDLFIVEYGLMTEEQKEDLAADKEFGMYGTVFPLAFMTADDVADRIKVQKNMNCELSGEYNAFIGSVKVFKLS